jgi:glycosyltransferase involved in cell wall biosynthesis
MTNAAKKSQNLEILISTMGKTSLSFLDNIFPANRILDVNILIINQTSSYENLRSTSSAIKVINSSENGLPNSRNLALKNASGDICIIADDDIHYVNDFKEIILSAFDNKTEADIITFQMMNPDGALFRDYKNIEKHTKDTVYTANSVVIAFRLESVKQRVSFNPYFGLGAKFEVADEYVFLRNALKAGLTIYFEPKIILAHPNISSGQDAASNRVIYGRSALFYKYFGWKAYLKSAHHIYRTFSDGKLSISEIIPKFGVACKGISDYKELLKKGLENR